jgi:putative DNA primase/helicase
VPDKGLRDKLKAELPGIFNRALCGLERLVANDAFTPTKSVLEAKQTYIRENDHMRVFLQDCVIPEKQGTIVKKEFREVYKNWCDRYGVRDLHDAAIKDTLKQTIAGVDEWRDGKNGLWHWLNIKWSDDAADYMPPTLTVSES